MTKVEISVTVKREGVIGLIHNRQRYALAYQLPSLALYHFAFDELSRRLVLDPLTPEAER
jgi:hypothetical protein